jgi:hypothetical protein
LSTEYFKVLKLKHKTAAITVHSVEPVHHVVVSRCVKHVWRPWKLTYGTDNIILTLHVWNRLNEWNLRKFNFDTENILNQWKICCIMNFLGFSGRKSCMENALKGQSNYSYSYKVLPHFSQVRKLAEQQGWGGGSMLWHHLVWFIHFSS